MFILFTMAAKEELVNSLFGVSPKVLAEQLTLRDLSHLSLIQLSFVFPPC
jgi:hypothetical protein